MAAFLAAAAPAPAGEESAAQRTPSAPVLQHWPSLPEGRTSFGAVALDGAIYLYGGHVGRAHAYSRDAVRGDLRRLAAGGREWESLAVGPALQGTALTCDGAALIRVGGLAVHNGAGETDQLESVASVQRFDLATRTWSDLPALPEPRSSHDALCVDGRLLVVGGWTIDAKGRRFAADSFVLDLRSDAMAWRTIPGPATSRRALALAALGGRVAAIGGMASDGTMLRTVEWLDLATEEWSAAPDFPATGFGIAAATVGEAILASAHDGALCRLRADSTAWERADEWLVPRFFHRLLPVGDQLVAVGGAGGGGQVRLVESIRVAPRGAEPRATLHAFEIELPGRARNRQATLLTGSTLWLAGGNGSSEQHAFAAEDFAAEITRVDLAALAASVVGELPQPRQSQHVLLQTRNGEPGLLLGGFGHDADEPGSTRSIVEFDLEHGLATPAPFELPSPRTQFQARWLGDTLWIAGGWDYLESREPAAIYPTAVLRSEGSGAAFQLVDSGLALPRPRRAFGGAALGERWYFVGGLDPDFAPIAACDVLDLASGTWSTIASPHDVRVGPELVAHDGALLLVGGSLLGAEGGASASQRIERFDPAAGTWSTVVESLPFPLRHLRALPWRGRILLVAPGSGRRLALGVLRIE